MDAMSTLTHGGRLNGFIISNWVGSSFESMVRNRYTPVDLDISSGSAKCTAGVNLRSLAAGNTFRIATKEMKGQIRKSCPPQHIALCIRKLCEAGGSDPRGSEETLLSAMRQIAELSLKRKHLARGLYAVKPLFLRGLTQFLLLRKSFPGRLYSRNCALFSLGCCRKWQCRKVYIGRLS